MALRKFTDGDVFYADDIDGLVAASNMRFATAAARTATLTGGLAVQQGMVTALADDQMLYRYVGTQWTPLPGTVVCAYASTVAQTLGSGGVYLYVASWDVNLLGTRAYAGVVTPTTSNFTFSQAGYYEISAGVCIAQPATDPGGNRTIAIYRGATIEQTTMQSGTFGATSNYHFLHTVPSVLALTAGQTASVQLNNQGNAAVTVNPTAQYPAYFTAKYLGQ